MTNSNSDNVTKRSVVDRRLTWGELDTNFEELIRAIDDIEVLESGLNGKVEQTVYTNKMQSLDTINQQQTEDIEDLQQNLISGLSGGAPIYENVTEGLNSTEIDRYFNVPSNDEEESLILYYHDTGDVAVEKKRIPSATAIQNSRKESKLAIRLQESISGRFPDFRSDFKLESYGTRLNDGYFTPAEFDDLISLSRPSVKYVWDRYGKLVEVPAGQPAFDHDPVTGEPLGQRIESVEATNRLPYSNDFLNWDSVADPVLTPNSGSFPAAVDNQMTLLEGLPGYISASGHSDVGVIYCHSVYAKAASGSELRIFIANSTEAASAGFDLSTEEMEVTGGSPKDYGMIYCGDGIYRCWVSLESIDSGVNSRTFRIYADGVLIWGAQREAGNRPTSYIPTDGSVVTRAADVVNANTSFAEQYDPARGWLFINFEKFGDGDDKVFQAQDSGSMSNSNSVYVSGVLGGLFAIYNEQTEVVFIRRTDSFSGHHKVLVAWGAGRIKVFIDGIQEANVSGEMPNVLDTLNFFRRKDGSTPGNGRLFEFQMGDMISDADAIARTTL